MKRLRHMQRAAREFGVTPLLVPPRRRDAGSVHPSASAGAEAAAIPVTAMARRPRPPIPAQSSQPGLSRPLEETPQRTEPVERRPPSAAEAESRSLHQPVSVNRNQPRTPSELFTVERPASSPTEAGQHRSKEATHGLVRTVTSALASSPNEASPMISPRSGDPHAPSPRKREERQQTTSVPNSRMRTDSLRSSSAPSSGESAPDPDAFALKKPATRATAATVSHDDTVPSIPANTLPVAQTMSTRLTPAVSASASRADEAGEREAAVRIGSIDVHVEPPPRLVETRDSDRPLARGLASCYGLRQG